MKADNVSIRDEIIQALEELNPSLVGVALSDSQPLSAPPVCLDSLDAVQLLLLIEDRLNIQVGVDTNLGLLTTIGNLVSCLAELCIQNESMQESVHPEISQ